MRLGDLDALKDEMSKVFFNDIDDMRRIEKLIDNAPTVEPETSRLALIEDIRKKQMDADKAFLEGYERGKNERPQGEWIPVSEGLPKDRDWYLGVFREPDEPDTGFLGLPYICDYVGEVTKGTTNEGWILRHCTDVDNVPDYFRNLICVAWQPLPEPYKAEMRGKEE